MPTLKTDAITAAMDAETADVALAQSGDARAFERLYRTHVPRVHGLVRRMMSGGDPDDVTQDVFVRVWEKLHTFRGESAFGTWLHRLAVNVILAKRKTLGGERRRFGDDAHETLELVPGNSSAPEHGVDFEGALARLPEGARQVFVLHDVQGYRHEEIAKLLGIVPGTSKSQLHHARVALRKYLDR